MLLMVLQQLSNVRLLPIEADGGGLGEPGVDTRMFWCIIRPLVGHATGPVDIARLELKDM